MLPRQVEAMLDGARLMISESMQRQHQRHELERRYITEQVAMMTSRLLSVLDEAPIYEILADHLPEVRIRHMAVAFFEPQNNDPVAWCSLRAIPQHTANPLRFPTRSFPPEGLYSPDEPFSLALLPLTIRQQQVGFVVFHSSQLEFCGSIVEQLSSALRSARL